MKTNINDIMKNIASIGNSFYVLDSKQFIENYNNLLGEFRKIYPNTYIAYSYKTNYIPKLCYLNDKMGGFAEIVSDMEGQIAKKIGVVSSNIYFNGPYKNLNYVEQLLVEGGCVNIDSFEEAKAIIAIADKYPNKILNVALRLNFDISDGVVSRFGIDVKSSLFDDIILMIKSKKNLHLKGLHSHFASRNIKHWKDRVNKIGEIIDTKFSNINFEFIDLGGGLYGNMEESLKKQFNDSIPNYSDYANVIAAEFKRYFDKKEYKPMLFLEPGTALVGDAMQFVAKIVSIKDIRGKKIATVLGSIYNINPTLNKKNPPIKILSCGQEQHIYNNLDFGGFTCIESDYLYRNFSGKLAIGDYVLFENVGSYSIVLKPPFILPNFPVVDLSDGNIEYVKNAETFENVFLTYSFKF